jgi:hypothetical protein
MNGSKQFPDRARLVKFVRQVTGKSDKAAQHLLDQVHQGAEVALQQAAVYHRQHADAAAFVERLCNVVRAGIARLAEGRARPISVETDLEPGSYSSS